MKFYLENYIRDLLRSLRKQINGYRKKFKQVIRTVEKEVKLASFKIERRLKMTVAKFRDNARKTLKEIPPMLDDAFTVDSPKKAAQMAEVYGQELATALYETQLRLEGMQNAIIRAAAPIAQAVVPIVNRAITGVTALANTLGKLISAFMESAFGIKTYETNLKSAIGTTATFQRYLAGFDQIERIGSNSSGGLAGALIPDADAILPGWEKLAEKVKALAAPLKEINFTPAIEGARKALKALEPVLNAVSQALEWAWYNLLVPLAQWAAENVLPAFLEVLTTALETLGQIIEDVRPSLTWLWENVLKELAQWYGEKIVKDIAGMANNFQSFGETVKAYMPTVEGMIAKLDEILGLGKALCTDGSLLQQIMANVLPILSNIGSGISALPGPMGLVLSLLGAFLPALQTVGGGFSGLQSGAQSALDAIKGMLGGLWNFTEEKVLGPTETGTKSFLNKIIGFFEGSISGISGSYNKLFAGLGANFQNMETVAPSIGGAARGVKFTNIYVPPIPRLAQGAVLPANKPFMAVVGDQTHGTNVEAPLKTIQEALDLTLADRMEGMMAGFNAVTSRQEQILEAILGLDISEEALAGAVKRYERRMAWATGGV